MRLKERSSTLAMVRTSNVFARPGTPVMIEWPPTNSASSTCSTTSSWQIIAFLISRKRRSRAEPSLSSICSSLIVSCSTAMFPRLLSDYSQQQFLCFLVTGRGFERSQHCSFRFRLPAQCVIRAGDIVVRFGDVRRLKRERGLKFGECLLVVFQFDAQLTRL